MDPTKFSDKPNEEWKDIPGFKHYMISNYGKIYSKRKDIILKPAKHKRGGHLFVYLFEDDVPKAKCQVHVLVLETFASKRPSEKHVCRHLDGNPENNYIGNLTWGTQIDNILDRYNNPNDDGIKMNKEKIIKVKEMLIEGKRLVDIGKALDVSPEIIKNIKNGHNWKDIGPDLSKYKLRKKRPNLTEETVREIKELIKSGDILIKEIAKLYDIQPLTVSNIKNGIDYKWVK